MMTMIMMTMMMTMMMKMKMMMMMMMMMMATTGAGKGRESVSEVWEVRDEDVGMDMGMYTIGPDQVTFGRYLSEDIDRNIDINR